MMKAFASIIVLFWVASYSLAEEPNTTHSMTPDDFVSAYEAALASQEWPRVAPLIHADCVVIFSNGSLHRGKAAVEKAFRRNFAMIEDETYEISEVKWITKTKDFAVFTFVYHWSGLINGKAASGCGRGTSTLQNVNGSWMLKSEHLGPKAD